MDSTSRPRIVSPDTLRGTPQQRLPPGQVITRKWPVLHYGGVPEINPDSEDWRLRIFGKVENEFELSYREIREMPAVDVVCDMHCVTRWSRLDNTFTGVPIRALLDRAKVRPEARYVMCHGENGFTTNLPLEDFSCEDCILAYAWDGKDITPDHGWPLRGLLPRLYLWKSAKWIRGIELRTTDAPGFWEQNGYHMHGDPWKQERFSEQ